MTLILQVWLPAQGTWRCGSNTILNKHCLLNSVINPIFYDFCFQYRNYHTEIKKTGIGGKPGEREMDKGVIRN